MSQDEKTQHFIEARGRALTSAERLNPTSSGYNQGLGAQTVTKPTAEKVLKDAQTIYDWLIKDL